MDHGSDAAFLLRAIALAEENVCNGGRPFGAVVVRDGQSIAEGVNRTDATGDPTAHAEVEAVRAACRLIGNLHLPRAVVYANVEPCVMCQALAHATGVASIRFALTAGEAAAAGWRYSADSQRLQEVWTKTAGSFARQVLAPGATRPLERWAESARHPTDP